MVNSVISIPKYCIDAAKSLPTCLFSTYKEEDLIKPLVGIPCKFESPWISHWCFHPPHQYKKKNTVWKAACLASIPTTGVGKENKTTKSLPEQSEEEDEQIQVSMSHLISGAEILKVGPSNLERNPSSQTPSLTFWIRNPGVGPGNRPSVF